VRGRELAARMREEARAKAVEMRIASRQANFVRETQDAAQTSNVHGSFSLAYRR
jgi:hypothetical protein